MTIADIDATNNKIISIILEISFPVPYQASLESSYDGSFGEHIISQGMKTFHQIKETLDSFQVQKVSAVATAAFREAANGEWFAKQVQKEAHIPLKVIPQREEGVLAYYSGIAAIDYNTDKVIVWDIGTGSFQMTTMNGSNELTVFM